MVQNMERKGGSGIKGFKSLMESKGSSSFKTGSSGLVNFRVKKRT